MSRLWGRVTNTELPVALRSPLYSAWGKVFGSDLTEIKAQSLDDYPSLAQFFIRELKPGVRPLDPSSLVFFHFIDFIDSF